MYFNSISDFVFTKAFWLDIDAAYATYPFITESVEMHLYVISKLRQNANLRYSYTGKQKSRGRPRKYDGKVDFSEVSRLLYVKSLEGHQEDLHLYSQIVWHVSLKARLA